MHDSGEMNRPELSGDRSRVNSAGLLGKVLTFAAGAVLLVVGLVFSLLVLALAATAAVLILGVFWWKTREQRRKMRARRSGGRVIDGEAIRETRRP